MALLQSLPIAINDAIGIDEVLRVIARHVIEALDYEDCVIYVRDAPGSLIQVAAWGPKSPDGATIIDRRRLQFGEGIVGAAALQQATQLVANTSTDDRYVPDVGGGSSELAVPIVLRGQVLGVIDSEHPDVNFYGPNDAKLITTIAAIAAAQLHATFSEDALRATIAELEQTQSRLERLATTDPVTGLANRHLFEERLAQLIDDEQRIALCAMDLDGFKLVNDRCGHHEGDKILRAVARILDETLTGPDALVARIGGDEFAILAAAGMAQFSELCVRAVQEVELVMGRRYGQLEITTSAGLAFGSSELVWHKADEAMYSAKRAGGNRLREFDTTTDAQRAGSEPAC